VSVAGWELPLVARIADGDGAALLELRDRLGESIFDRVLSVTDDRMVATFVTTGVLMRVWRCPAEFAVRDLTAALFALAEERALEWLAAATEPPPVVLRMVTSQRYRQKGACDD
jgi:hypothetical protein